MTDASKPPAPRPLRVSADMQSFRCNQKGCCCHTWDIHFLADEALRLASYAPEPYPKKLVHGAPTQEVFIGGERRLLMQLNTVLPKRRCFFLSESEGRCEVHAQIGPEVLPHLCRAFPVVSFDVGEEALEVYHDAVCPEVLNVIADHDGAYDVATLGGSEDADLSDRSSRPLVPRHLSIGDRMLAHEAALAVRDLLVQAANERRVDPMRLLAEFSYSIADVARGEMFTLFDPETDPHRDYGAFEAFFDQCVGSHQARALYSLIRNYQRFVFEEEFPDNWNDLEQHLEFREDWKDRVDPLREDLQTLLYRFMAHRFYSIFWSSRNYDHIAIAYGNLAHTVATAMRFADGFCRWLGRPLQRNMLKVALGASEYFYRGINVPANAMLWFGPPPNEGEPEGAVE